MAGIKLQNIEKVYPGKVIAVHDFNLDIEDKEFIVLVGPSGCGKSTTLRMIAGLEEISGGHLYIGNNLMNDVPSKDRNISMVFQNYALYPHLTVYKNLSFGLEIRKTPKAEIDKKVKETAEILDITDYLYRKPKALSGGQRQRVALGRAMVRNPDVFLLDEPLSNLDAKLRASTRAELIKLHKRLGTTFIYVTHDQVEAMTMGDRIVVMKDGLIQQTDTPQNLYEKPCNEFVAGFIGSPQMNFLKMSLNKDKDGFSLHTGDVVIKLPKPKNKNSALEGYTDKMVKVGIRPESIHAEAGKTVINFAKIQADVEMAEMMGSEIYLYCIVAGNRIVSRVLPSRKYVAGQKAELTVDTDKIHIFDAETGKTITK